MIQKEERRVMTSDEPLSEARLAVIRERVDNLDEVYRAGDGRGGFRGLGYGALHSITLAYHADVPALLADNERLRAREAAHEAREEQMRGVVEIMAKGPLSWNPEYGDICACCDRAWIDGDPDDDQPGAIQHTSDCAVVLARALLASESRL